MSTVLWMALETDSEDNGPDDLGLIYDDLDELDRLCGELKVSALSDFVDNSDIIYNLSDTDFGQDWVKENAKWIDPTKLMTTMKALENVLADDENNEEILDEIRHVMNRCIEAKKQNVRARLIIVM